MSAEWWPTEHEFLSGQDAYIRYLSGVAIVNAPHAATALGIIGEGMENPEQVLVHAETLMYGGLRSAIFYALDPTYRHHLQAAENVFDQAVPHMRRTVDTAYESQAVRIQAINYSFQALRPAPQLDEKIYKALCHSRRDKLRTVTLLDGVQPASDFSELLQNRKIGDVVVGHGIA